MQSLLRDKKVGDEQYGNDMQINKYFAVGEEYLWFWCQNFGLCLDNYYDGLTRLAKKGFNVWWNWEREKSFQPEID